MRLRLFSLTLLILFFLIAAAILWPASALAPQVEGASGGHWRLANAEGSIWNGHGVLLTQAGESTNWQIAQNIRWQMHWSELWRGRIGIDTRLEQGGALIALTFAGLSIEQLDATLPAPALLVLLPGALGRYGWGGQLHLRSKVFRCAWNSYACAGEIELQWNEAEVAEVPGNKLGDYRFRMVGESQALRIDIATLSGNLQINGSGEISPRGLSFKGEATAAGPNATTLGAMLNTLGRRSEVPGKYLLDYREPGSRS